jgi:hypothetical protein
MSVLACTGFGEAVLVTVTSAFVVVPTTVLTLAVLLVETGSLADELTASVSVIIVPFATPVFTFVTSVNVAAVDPTMSTFEQTALPAVPIAGVMQLHPSGAAMETKVVFAGTVEIRVALSAALGPLLVTICV